MSDAKLVCIVTVAAPLKPCTETTHDHEQRCALAEMQSSDRCPPWSSLPLRTPHPPFTIEWLHVSEYNQSSTRSCTQVVYHRTCSSCVLQWPCEERRRGEARPPTWNRITLQRIPNWPRCPTLLPQPLSQRSPNSTRFQHSPILPAVNNSDADCKWLAPVRC